MDLEDVIKGLFILVLVGLVIWLYVWALITVGTYFKLPWYVLLALLVLFGNSKHNK